MKVLWYLLTIPRFKHLFANGDYAKDLTWHANRRNYDGMLCRPVDSSQWKKIDRLYLGFDKEARNLRLGLATDGMNPHGSLSTQHNSWPVLLVIYNLPPWLYMKRKYMMLSMMISGPRQPGNDIDIYLSPLIEDLKKLCDAILPRKGLVTRAMSKRLQEDWARVDKEGLRVLMNLRVDF